MLLRGVVIRISARFYGIRTPPYAPHFAHSSVRAKNQRGKRCQFHVNNSLLVLPFLLFLMLHEDQFCIFVLVTR